MFCALLGQISGEHLQDHWSSGLFHRLMSVLLILLHLRIISTRMIEIKS